MVKIGDEEWEWMYCFNCHTSHYFVLQSDGSWRCPNCEARCHSNPISDAADAEEAALKAAQKEEA